MFDEIKKVCFVGAGTMGSGNSMVAAASGYQVAVYDPAEGALRAIPERYELIGRFLIDHGYFSQAEVAAAASRITLTSDPFTAARDADLLSESVPERVELKRGAHRMFDAICPAHAIMTTNTSFIAVSDIESAVARGERFAALHYHLGSKLVDIMKGPRTAEATVRGLERYVRNCRLIPIIHKKERAGYLYNFLLTGLLWTAVLLVADRRATPREVDRAWIMGTEGWNGPGPFGIIDYIGIDVFTDATRDAARHASGAVEIATGRVMAFLQPYLERNELGFKSGKGFYGYPDPELGVPDLPDRMREDHPLCKILTANLIANALTLVADGYAAYENVDRSWIIALEINNVDIGPFGLLDRWGLDAFLREFSDMSGVVAEGTGEKVHAFLKPYIDEGRLGLKADRGFYAYPDPAYRKPGFLVGEPLKG